uniref:JmjC domain-containing protein n=1 Tax=Eptatretus burgeri TaxID=7764 RepID=A0A8C4QJJ4_EPTBU
MATTWPALGWTLEHLSEVTGEQRLQFRLGKMQPEKTPQFETDCRYILATLHQFTRWCAGDHGETVGPFLDLDPVDTWAYADYKYLAVLFPGNHQFLQGLVWSDFGYLGRDGRQSTLWIGSDGAGTPCHQDTYGSNLVLQIQGRCVHYDFQRAKHSFVLVLFLCFVSCWRIGILEVHQHWECNLFMVLAIAHIIFMKDNMGSLTSTN